VTGPGFRLATGLLLTALSAMAQVPAPPPAPARADTPAWSQVFWTAIDKLGVVMKAVGNLGVGVDQGQIWMVDLATGQQRRVATAEPLAWPVLSPHGQAIFALRAGQLVRLTPQGADVVPLGTGVQWRKLVGVDGQDNVLGFVAGKPRVHPALMTPTGVLHLLPQPETAEERERVALLLQENRAYAGGRELLVKRSKRGGRGYDIGLIADGAARNLSDCGDDFCGQPSLSPDGRYVLYVRAIE
jgi:hypothetical protein